MNTEHFFQKSIEHWAGRSIAGSTASGIEADAKDGKFTLKGSSIQL